MLTANSSTIAAIATPPGTGGVAIIRLSGKEAISIASKIFTGPVHSFATHTAHYGRVVNLNRELVDDVLLLVMRGSRSYTGEDTVEIHCHGGALITRKVLETVLSAGARLAEPGEFTLRAFLNGKMDLAQAEAVQELIAAKNEYALAAAENQLRGALSAKILSFQKGLIDIAAMLEAWVDFPEEGIEFAPLEEVKKELQKSAEAMEALLATFHDGQIAKEGISLCLAGKPNVGKSSLMNALLKKERAIVSSIPGTTRDLLEDHLLLGGLHFRLTDTAGIRETDEVIEQEGVRRSKEALQKADLTLLVLDIASPLTHEDEFLFSLVPKDKTIVVWNKADLSHSSPPSLPFPHIVTLSAKEGKGLEELKQEIDRIIWTKGPPSLEEATLTNVRHKEALSQAIVHCRQVIEGLSQNVSPEFLAYDMRSSLASLGKIIGLDITEDILSAIFSKFCVGK